MATIRTTPEMIGVYKSLPEDFAWPYVVKVTKEPQQLCFLGMQHTTDSENAQFDTVTTLWNKWLEVARDKKVVLIEGGLRKSMPTIQDAIKTNGEAGYITYLATQQSITLLSPEPDRKAEAHSLLQQFDEEDIIHFYFARSVYQWGRRYQHENFETYINRYIKTIANNLDIESLTLSDCMHIHDTVTGHTFDPQNSDCHYHYSVPMTSPISEASSAFRNTYIFSIIKEKWDAGYSLFVVYGSGHAIVLEPALSNLD